MNPRYDTVKDMQGENITLVQDQSSVDHFNRDYDQDYSYYFIDSVEGRIDNLYGSYSILMHSNVYYVGEQ